MTIRIIKESDIIRLPGLLPTRVGIAEHNGKYLTFTTRIKGDRQEPIESSILPAPNLFVAQRQYCSRIRNLEGI
jgi:hypothetical protein